MSNEDEGLIYLDATGELATTIAMAHGAARVLAEIQKHAEAGKNAPGFRLALIEAERTVAEMRVGLAAEVLRYAAKAGFNIAEHPEIFSGIRKTGPYIALKPADLLSGLEP